MTATTQVAPRSPFRFSRYKPNESTKPIQPQPIVKPTGGSRQTQPFDPSELSRRLELYQKDLKLARARQEIVNLNKKAQNAKETASPADRNDSGQDSEQKTEVSSIQEVVEEVEENEEETTSEDEPEKVAITRPESIKQSNRPKHTRKVSASRVRRNPPGTYFPQFAAKQFSATTTPLPVNNQKTDGKTKETSSSKRRSVLATTATSHVVSAGPKINIADAPQPKTSFANELSMPKPAERTTTSALDYNTIRADRRRSAMIMPDTSHRSLSANTRAPARPRPLSTALENLNLNILEDSDYDDEINPYNPSAIKPPRHVEDTENCILKDLARPALVDRYHQHDWSQASQCGDSERQSLHLDSIWKKDDSKSSSLAKQRGKSHGEVADTQTMIADAVKLVKEDRRRSSFLSFFRRLH